MWMLTRIHTLSPESARQSYRFLLMRRGVPVYQWPKAIHSQLVSANLQAPPGETNITAWACC